MPIFVNHAEISDDDVHREMQHHPAPSVDDAREAAARALVIRELLLQEAMKGEMVKPEPEEQEAAISRLIDREVKVPLADAGSCKRYYEHNQARFKDSKTGQVLPYDLVEGHIRDYLYARSFHAGLAQYLSILAARNKIIGFQLEESETAARRG